MKRPRCEAQTKQGRQCHAFALPGRPWCFTHDPEKASERRAARQAGAKKAGELRKARGRRRKLDSAAGLIAYVSDIVQRVERAEMAPDVGRCVLYGVSIQRQLVETGDLEQRLAALEAQQGAGGKT
jgi:hypothetical protein